MSVWWKLWLHTGDVMHGVNEQPGWYYISVGCPPVALFVFIYLPDVVQDIIDLGQSCSAHGVIIKGLSAQLSISLR